MACNEWFKIGGCHRESDITNKSVVIKSQCSISSYLRPVIKEKVRLISQSLSVNGLLPLTSVCFYYFNQVLAAVIMQITDDCVLLCKVKPEIS